MATSEDGTTDDPEGQQKLTAADIVNEAERLQAEIDAYQKLKEEAQKNGDVNLTDYYDTQMQTIQNEINRLFGIRPNPWRGG